MERTVNQFPIQKLSLTRKNEEWRKDCVDYIIGAAGITNSNDIPDDEEIQSYYDLYNSIYNEKDLKYVTNPFNQNDGFPAMAQDYNIIRPKIDLLLGEETKRPFNFVVCHTSDIASSDVQEKAKQMLMDFIQASIMAKLGPEEQAQYQQALQTGEIMTPEQIQKYLTKDYKDIAELTAYHSLKYLIKQLNLPHEFFKGWRDALIAGREIYYVGIRNGEPYVESVNPKDFKFMCGDNIEYIHDSSWCDRKMLMSVTELYDQFYDKLTEKQLNELLERVGQKPTSGYGPDKSPTDDFLHIKTKTYSSLPNHNPYSDVDDIIVHHVCWKSFKKIGFITIMDEETGIPDEIQVDEFYNPTGDELNVEWTWITETWEGYKAESGLDDGIYFGMQPVEYQFMNSNLNSTRLPYTGVIYSNANSKSRSLVSIMKPLQYMYIVLWYRLELAISRDKGKVPLIDVTTIPKSMGIDVDKWMHYLSALGVAFINPYEEGWDIPGREGGKPTSFNNFTSMDLTMGNSIATYIQLLDKIEQMVSELTGITPQRQGAISSNELVGNVERSVVQSAHITEPLYWMHSQAKREVLSMLLDTAKHAWKNSDKQYLNYILDDATRAFITLDEDFSYADFDIFVSDSSEDNKVIDQMQQLIQPAMQNGASLLDIMHLLTDKNLSMIESKLEEIENNRIQQQQAMQEQEAQQQQQLVQMQNEVKEQELMLKEAELDLQKYKIDQDNITKITVAQLNAYRGNENMDQDMNGIPDPIEIGKQAIEQQKVNSDVMAKQMDLANKARAEENKKQLESRKIAAQKESEKLKASIEKERLKLEERKLQEAKKLQAMKDRAAMEREKLKAKTALKNKVVGESKTKK